jgi:hypothetical protein
VTSPGKSADRQRAMTDLDAALEARSKAISDVHFAEIRAIQDDGRGLSRVALALEDAKARLASLSDEQVARAWEALQNIDDDPLDEAMLTESIDAELRAAGIDPDELAGRAEKFIAEMKAKYEVKP